MKLLLASLKNRGSSDSGHVDASPSVPRPFYRARTLIAILLALTLPAAVYVSQASAATTLTAVSWAANNPLTNAASARYDYNFTTATTTTMSRATMSVPAGTSCPNRYLATNGVNANGNGMSTPDSAATSFTTGDFDFRIKVSLDDWTPSANQYLFDKYNTATNKRSYRMYVNVNGEIVFGWSTDGSNGYTTTSDVLGLADGATKWIRATFHTNEGGGNAQAYVYTSDDNVTFTQVDIWSSSTLITWYDSDATVPLELGYRSSINAEALVGRIYYYEARNGFGGPIVTSFDPSLPAVATSPNSWTSATGEVWTLQRSGTNMPADITCPLTVSANTNVGAGTASLRMYEKLAVYKVTTPASIASGVAVSIGLTGFTNTPTAGSYTSIASTYDNAATPLLISDGTSSNSVAFRMGTWATDSTVPSTTGVRYDYTYATSAPAGTIAKVHATVPSGTSSNNTRYADMPGTPAASGNSIATPDSVANSITGDLDLRVKVALDDWTPASTYPALLAKANSNRSYQLYVSPGGNLTLQTSSNGTSWTVTSGSTVAPTVSDGATLWVRSTMSVNNGSGGNTATFYTSADGNSWTTLGSAVVNAGTTSIYDSPDALEVGSSFLGTGDSIKGKMYYAEVRSGINGTVVNKFDPAEVLATSPSSWVASTGETWTVTRSGTTTIDIASDITVSANSGIGAGTAKLRLIDGAAIYYVTTPASVAGNTTISFGLTGFKNTPPPGTYSSTITSYTSAPTAIDTGTTNSIVFDTAPSTPTALLQATTTDVVVPVGGPVGATSVKFVATISDPDVTDTLALCVEVKAVGSAFTNTDTGCGSTVGYSGTGVSASYTAGSLSAGTSYHWQARTKDNLGLYSAWTSYGNNSDTVTAATDFVSTPALTSTSWSSDSLGTGSPNRRYDWGFTSATTATVSKITASVPPGTSGSNRYLALPGVTNNYAYSSNSATNSITGSIDVRAKVALPNWYSSDNRYVITKRLGGSVNDSWSLVINSANAVEFAHTNDGTNFSYPGANLPAGWTANSEHWVRAVANVSTSVTTLYHSSDGVNWTSLGTGFARASLNPSTHNLTVGTISDGGLSKAMNVYYADVRTTLGGATSASDCGQAGVVACFDPNSAATLASPSSWTAATGETWNVGRTVIGYPADIASDLTVSANTGVSAGTASLRLIDGAAVYKVTTPASITSGTAMTLGLTGFTNVASPMTFTSTIGTYNNSATPAAVDAATTNSLTFTVNSAPETPTSLAQKTTGDAVINAGAWHNSQTVKFTATGTDSNSPDTLYLCVEMKALGVGFSNAEDSCGSGVAYSGSGVPVTHTIASIADATEYHWQARLKDSAGLYSPWVSFGANAESARDFGVDTTAPTGGTVYDGTNAGVDASFNDGSLSSLSANWSGVNSNVSGMAKYEYSIGTSANSTDVRSWTDNATATSVTATGLSLRTSVTYYVNVRTTDGAGNVSSTLSSNGQQVAPSLTFTVTPGQVNLVNVPAAGFMTDVQSATLTTSTNGYGGYSIRAAASGPMMWAGGAAIPAFTGGSYASPDAWQPGDLGVGYTSDDPSIQGVNKFQAATCPGGSAWSAPGCYAPFNTTAPGDIVADHTDTLGNTPITNEVFHVTFRATTSALQAAGRYVTDIAFVNTVSY